MKTLFVYDKTGTIIASSLYTDEVQIPVGVPSVIVDIPEGVIVTRIDPSSGLPIYSKNTPIVSEVDRCLAKIDYIAMMLNINLDQFVAEDKTPYTYSKTSSNSEKYEKVRSYYMKNLWTTTAVKNAVGRWITSSEYDKLVVEKTSSSGAIKE